LISPQQLQPSDKKEVPTGLTWADFQNKRSTNSMEDTLVLICTSSQAIEDKHCGFKIEAFFAQFFCPALFCP
jgi:hypothetical protein